MHIDLEPKGIDREIDTTETGSGNVSEESYNESFAVHNPNGDSNILIVCDHATWNMPTEYAFLGVPREALYEHIGWDIGALKVAAKLADKFNAQCISTKFSRLLTDANRFPGDPSQFLSTSDDVPVPGNTGIDSAEKESRLQRFFWPYHHTVEEALKKIQQQDSDPILVSVHSFTPSLVDNSARPWHIGILWNDDDRLAKPLIKKLSQNSNICVGDNQPYSGRSPLGYTVATHAEKDNRLNVLIEIRQDLIGDDSGVTIWSEALFNALQQTLQTHVNRS